MLVGRFFENLLGNYSIVRYWYSQYHLLHIAIPLIQLIQLTFTLLYLSSRYRISLRDRLEERL